MNDPLIALNTVADLSARYGGTSVVIPALCRAVRDNNSDVNSFILSARVGDLEPSECLYRESEALVRFPQGRSFYQELTSLVPKESTSRTLIHDHGMWLLCNHQSASFAKRKGVAHIITPHGMLTPWTLKYKPWRKRLAWYAYTGRDLANAKLLHATSATEASGLRRLGLKQPIAVIPNGVDDIESANIASEKSARPYALFLSRIHEVKGIAELIEAWKSIHSTDWELVIAGPDQQGLVRGKNLPANIRYVGEVSGQAKVNLLQNAALFVLPSHTENFGLVVAESLMTGVPVITTHGTPWSGLVEHDCGWWIPISPRELRETIVHAMSLPSETRRQMGMRGQAWMKRDFTWQAIGNKMADVYRWVLGTTSQTPSSIQS